MITQNDGTCFEKKANPKHIGNKNQDIFFSFFIAKIKIQIPNKEKKAEWWSTKGVPLVGYASTENNNE